MLGLSTSYFGFQGKPIYDSVKAVFGLGFGTAELGAGHAFEKNVWETIKKVKQDFPEKNYTVHGLFPPLEKRTWFNASLGLTKQNKAIADSLFAAAQIVEAKVVGIHPGFRKQVEWKESPRGMCYPVPKEEIPLEKAWSNLFELIQYCLNLAEETGCLFAIENTTDHAVKSLVFSEQDFEKVFQKFPKLGLLLDIGHAMYMGRLEGFLQDFSKRIQEIHLHLSRVRQVPDKGDEHRPITLLEELKPLSKIRQFRQIPVIFEHGTNVSNEQILAEKKIVEGFERIF